MIRYMIAGAVLFGLAILVTIEIIVCLKEDIRTKNWNKEIDNSIQKYTNKIMNEFDSPEKWLKRKGDDNLKP